MYRKQDGTPIALEDRCCHRRAPLSKGKIEGDRIRCGYHGFVYEPTGTCSFIPGQERIPPNARVRTYPLVEKHGWVWIWMGDPALARPEDAPAFYWYDKPGWACSSERLPIKGSYQLMVDNLLDLSHLPFLHPGSVGNSGDITSDLHWEKQAPHLLRGTRLSTNNPPSPRFEKEGITFLTDKMQVMTYTAPSSISIEVFVTEAGKKPGDPTSRIERQIVILNSMTPETQNTCHYFWGTGRNYMVEDEELTRNTHRMMQATFDEDKDMIEGQQRIIDLDPNAPQVYVAADAGATQARRMMERLIEEERLARAPKAS